MSIRLLAAVAVLALCAPARAADFHVGPGRPYATLQALTAAVTLQPGDRVLVDPGSYSGGVILRQSGTAAAPIRVIGLRGAGGQRAVLAGGGNSIEFRRADHVVLEGFEITGGTSRCVFVNARDVVLRDLLVRDCPAQGILSSDLYSGNLTLEYSEIRNAGAGSSQHALYIQSDEVSNPGSVFRMRFNYVHSGNGGNLLKSRHERNEIHYNWFEGAWFHEIELIGPDQFTQLPGWSVGLVREDSEVLGNVIVHSSPLNPFGAVIRLGGDGTGESRGRYRLVNNTIVVTGSSNPTTVLRLFEGIESVEAHNNVIWRSSPGELRIERTVEAVWAAGGRRVAGSNNWINAAATVVPPEWTGMLTGASPGFVAPAAHDYRPGAASPLNGAGNGNPTSPPAWPFPAPTLLPQFLPPQRAAMAPGSERTRPGQAPPTIGAVVDADPLFANGFQ
ncbi:MAG: hypothetical protein KF823_06340 [Xanthomonadales bacterium]|nr:hypothetical protein [Xanthomonadales bacterium]